MKKFLVLLLGLLLAGTAMAELPANLTEVELEAFMGDAELTGVLTLPETVQKVGNRAFAATGLHALIVPAGCESLAGDVLADAQAAYVMLDGTATAISGDALTDVPCIFAPRDSAASPMDGFYAAESLCVADGVFYTVKEGEALPLCAVMPLEGEVILPKFLEEQPVISLDSMTLRGCENAVFQVPSYLTVPEGMSAAPYDCMMVSAPTANVAESAVGDPITWTTRLEGAYGDVSYIWLFDVEGAVSSIITSKPTVTWSPTAEGLCIVKVTAIDALGDKAEARSAGITIGPAVPIYRALLVGNIYTGTVNELPGCDTDVYAMRSMLNSMQGTDYAVTTYIDLTASEIQSRITSTFADARACDVSLFYFSGHGTSEGQLVGMGNSVISPGALRNWLDQIPGTKIVIIDCCYSGRMIGKSEGSTDPSAFTSAFISSFSYFNKDNNLANNGYIVMTACTQEEESASLGDGTISFGAFTYGVCYGSGYEEWDQKFLGYMPADANGDGSITLGESYNTTLERVNWLMSVVGFSQSAQYYGDTEFVLWTQPAVP